MNVLLCIAAGLCGLLAILVGASIVIGAMLLLLEAVDWVQGRLSSSWRRVFRGTLDSIGRIILGLMIGPIVLCMGDVIYLSGCANAYEWGWIDDCPTCVVQDAPTPTLEN